MAVVVSVINLKGGVGKSTIVMILAEYLAFHFRKRVLLIDMDAQANLSYIMVPYRWIETQQKNQTTIYDFLSYLLTNPQEGFLAETREIEGAKYRLHERMQRLTEEFASRVGIL